MVKLVELGGDVVNWENLPTYFYLWKVNKSEDVVKNI